MKHNITMYDIELIKKASLDYPVHPLIASRWSPRAYDVRPVEPEKLQRIFEAARWAASSSNLQPWYFLVGFNGDEVYRKIFDTLVEFNQLWVVNAPVLVLAIAKTTNHKGEPNNSFAYDLGQSVAILSLQAMAEGIHTHQMGGFNATEAARSLEIPAEYKVMVAFTLGYLGDAEILHPNLIKLEKSPRVRRSSTESVFTGSFGHKADFL
jgi:nitroreductase